MFVDRGLHVGTARVHVEQKLNLRSISSRRSSPMTSELSLERGKDSDEKSGSPVLSISPVAILSHDRMFIPRDRSWFLCPLLGLPTCLDIPDIDCLP